MTARLVVLLSLLVAVPTSNLAHGKRLWFDCDSSLYANDYSNHPVRCVNNSDVLWIQPCYCIYYDSHNNITLVGDCFYTCLYKNLTASGGIYYPIPQQVTANSSQINENVCNLIPEIHRTGRFCSKCKKGYGLAAYSYKYLQCIPCHNYRLKNWIIFLVAALAPLTVFYVVVILLRIHISSSYLNCLVFVVHCLTLPIQQRVLLGSTYVSTKESHSLVELYLIKVELTIYGAFNLDFFRAFFPDICLHPDLNFMSIASLDLIIALYPFLLIGVTYILVQLFDRLCSVVNLKIAVKKIFNCYDYRISRNSIVETFATFILLSNIKILGVCCDLLFPSVAIRSDGKTEQFLYYDGSIEYFGSRHLPFALLAIVVGFIFVLLPFLLLLFYPWAPFQKVLGFFKVRGHGLHIFMDIFQGSYRTHPRDLRVFSAYYPFLRFILTFGVVYFRDIGFWIPVNGVIILLSIIAVVIFQPYKNPQHNQRDIILLLELTFIYMSYTLLLLSTTLAKQWLRFTQVLLIISTVLMLFTYVGILLSRWKLFSCVVVWVLNSVKKLCHYHRNNYQVINEDSHIGIMDDNNLRMVY